MGIFNNLVDDSTSGSGNGAPGPRGLPGRGVNSITTIDNNDGSISLTFNMSDNTTEQSSGTLVSDSLLNLNKLSLEGTNDVNKLLVKQENETVVMNANSVNGVVEIPNVKSSNLIVGNTNYILPATNLENGLLKSTIDGGNIQLTWATAPDDLQFGTGLRSGGVISINADPTKFNLQAGEGVIASDILTYFSWTTFTAQSIPNPIPLQPNGTPVSLITTRILTYISINSTGTLLFSSELPDAVSQRTYVYLGILVHTLTINPIPDYTINTINHQQVCIEHGVNQLHDLCAAIGFININGNGLGLGTGGGNKIAKEAGKIFAVNANTVNDHDNPHIVSLPTVDTGLTGTFQYRNRNGTSSALTLTDFIPNLFDNGSNYNGSTPTIPTNRWGISYVFVFTSGALKIQPPQFSYSTTTEALLNLDSENFIIESSIAANGLLIGYIIARQGSTLASAPAVFVKAKKFGSSGGSSSGTGVDLSSRLAVDGSNSMTGSLVVASATSPAMDIKGSGSSVLTVSGGAVTKKVTVLGDLDIKYSDGTSSYLYTNQATATLYGTYINATKFQYNNNSLNFTAIDPEAGPIVKLTTDNKPLYIQAPSTILTQPVSVFSDDLNRDILVNISGNSLDNSNVKINGSDSYLLLEPSKITCDRTTGDTWVKLEADDVKTNLPIIVEDQINAKSPQISIYEPVSGTIGGIRLTASFYDVSFNLLATGVLTVRTLSPTPTYTIQGLETYVNAQIASFGWGSYIAVTFRPKPFDIGKVQVKVTFYTPGNLTFLILPLTAVDLGLTNTLTSIGLRQPTNIVFPGIATANLPQFYIDEGGQEEYVPFPGEVSYTINGINDILTPYSSKLSPSILEFNGDTTGTINFSSDKFSFDKSLLVKKSSALALDVQNDAGSSLFKVDTTSPAIYANSDFQINGSGGNIDPVLTVSKIGHSVTIDGPLNNAVEGDIYYAGSGGYLTKLAKPPTNDCYKLVFEGGALQWEPQIYGEIQFDARVTNGGVGIRQALNFTVANTWYGIPYGENGSINITSTPANYLEVSNYFDAGGAGVDHMGFRYINGPTFKALIRFHVIIELITNGITTAGLFVNNTLDEMSLTPGFSNGDDSVAYDMSIITELTANTTVQAKIRSEVVSGGASYPEAFSVTVTRVC